MRVVSALFSGLAGASTLTVVHEIVRRREPAAPRLDVLGMRALAQALRGLSRRPPPPKRLFRAALLGDLLANTAYYSLVAVGKPEHVWRRGMALGIGAGIAAVALPKPLGLGSQPHARSFATMLMTVVWYLVGGLAAAAAARRTAPAQIGYRSRQAVI